MTGIELYSKTAASNNSAPPNGWPEGQAPSTVNDCARQMMAAIRTWYEGAEWINWGDTTTYVGATQFKTTGLDSTSRYTVGRRVKAVGSSTGTIYGTITVSAFVTDTTVTVSWDSGSLSNETLTISIGILDPTHTSNPNSPPFTDTTEIVKGSSDATKKIAFEADSITTGTTRTYTGPDKNGTLAMISDIIANNLVGTTTNDSATAGNVGEYFQTLCPNANGATVTITIASPGVVTYSSHGIVQTGSNNAGIVPIVFTTTGALPTGITAGTTYYTIGSSITANTFQIATTVANAIAGTAINTTGSQSGTHTGTFGQAPSTGTTKTLAVINLSAGDWDVWGSYDATLGGASTTVIQGGISLTNNTIGGQDTYVTFPFPTTTLSNTFVMPIPMQRVSIASTTPVYLVGNVSYSAGTVGLFGSIYARRRR